MNAYGEREYRAARAALELDTWWCWHGCGRRAVTPDHVPALAEHHHQAGSGCCQLRPSCMVCQLSTGAAVGNRHRRRASRSRLTPGSGWVGR